MGNHDSYSDIFGFRILLQRCLRAINIFCHGLAFVKLLTFL